MTSLASDAAVRTRSQRLELDAWGVVFCGGASRRMGRDKALLVLDGMTLLERAARTLAAVTPRVLLATGAEPRYAELGLDHVLDGEPGAGPLAGLAAALARIEHARIAFVCVLACDMPRVPVAVFPALLSRARAENVEACLVRTRGGLEPLCGVYHARCLPAVRAALARGERRMDSFHGDIRLVTRSEEELELDCTRNLNTPEEFRAAGGSLA